MFFSTREEELPKHFSKTPGGRRESKKNADEEEERRRKRKEEGLFAFFSSSSWLYHNLRNGFGFLFLSNELH